MKQTRSKTDLLHHWMDRLAPTGEKIEILSDPVELEDDLVKSGYPYGLTVRRIQGAKILGTFAGVGIGFLVLVYRDAFCTCYSNIFSLSWDIWPQSMVLSVWPSVGRSKFVMNYPTFWT